MGQYGQDFLVFGSTLGKGLRALCINSSIENIPLCVNQVQPDSNLFILAEAKDFSNLIGMEGFSETLQFYLSCNEEKPRHIAI